MQTSRFARTAISISKTVSVLLSPLFVPVLGSLIAFQMTALHHVSAGTRLTSLAIVAAFTAVLPLFCLYVLKATGRISDIDISNRKQRPLPIVLVIVCYALATLYIAGVHAPLWLTMYFCSGVTSAIVLGIITVAARWKVSMHGAGIGNLIGMCVALSAYGYADRNMLALITVAILAAGLIGSARVILNHHTLWQVCTGTAVSAVITFLMMGIGA